MLNDLKGKNGFTFDGYYNYFYTALDSTPKFPPIPDEDLLTLIQEKTFRYFYDFAHPACGMARERNSSGDVVTTGGSGFGIMALVVGMSRNFITRDPGACPPWQGPDVPGDLRPLSWCMAALDERKYREGRAFCR